MFLVNHHTAFLKKVIPSREGRCVTQMVRQSLCSDHMTIPCYQNHMTFFTVTISIGVQEMMFHFPHLLALHRLGEGGWLGVWSDPSPQFFANIFPADLNFRHVTLYICQLINLEITADMWCHRVLTSYLNSCKMIFFLKKREMKAGCNSTRERPWTNF